MGSGKTYWGSRLAEYLGVPFIDLDHYIESEEKTSIANLFEQKGEAGFRDLERQHLHRLAKEAPAIVATGGGTPCFFDNMAWMNQYGTTIYLKVPVGLLAARLRLDPNTRPLLSGVAEDQLENHIGQLLAHRSVYYEAAHIIAEQTGSETAFLRQLTTVVDANG